MREVQFVAEEELLKVSAQQRKAILELYNRSLNNTLRKIKKLRPLDPDTALVRRRLEVLRRDLVKTARDLAVGTERIVIAGKNEALDISLETNVKMANILNIDTNFNVFLRKDALPYVTTQLKVEDYPRLVTNYRNLALNFDTSDVKLLGQLNNDFAAQVQGLAELTWSPATAAVLEVKGAIIERLSYGELVTRLRREVWGLRPGARNKAITYKATRLARTELIKTAYLTNDTWGYDTPGIKGRRVWFGGGACDGSCLQFVGYWPYDEGPPESIPFHPHCACYITYETRETARQQNQAVIELEDGRYMDSHTFDVRMPDAEIRRRWSLQGSNDFPDPLKGQALKDNLDNRLR
jgi:hypothetical protein